MPKFEAFTAAFRRNLYANQEDALRNARKAAADFSCAETNR